jgi:hypothetical protein
MWRAELARYPVSADYERCFEAAPRGSVAGTGERGGWQFPKNRFVFGPEADLTSVMGAARFGW